MEEGSTAGLQPVRPSIHIANDVVGEIAAIAAKRVNGVAELSGGLGSGLNDMLGRRSLTRGVRADIVDRRVDLALHLIVGYGARIPEVAGKVQEQVKSAIESSTGLTVRRVDIHIQGVAFRPERPVGEPSPADEQ